MVYTVASLRYLSRTKAPSYRLVRHPDINFCHLIQRRRNKICVPQNRSLSSALIRGGRRQSGGREQTTHRARAVAVAGAEHGGAG